MVAGVLRVGVGAQGDRGREARVGQGEEVMGFGVGEEGVLAYVALEEAHPGGSSPHLLGRKAPAPPFPPLLTAHGKNSIERGSLREIAGIHQTYLCQVLVKSTIR